MLQEDLGAACCRAGSIDAVEDQQLLAPKTFCREQSRPERRSARSINVCEWTNGPRRLTDRVDVQGSARKDVVFGAARVYAFTVPGPKWNSWLKPQLPHTTFCIEAPIWTKLFQTFARAWGAALLDESFLPNVGPALALRLIWRHTVCAAPADPPARRGFCSLEDKAQQFEKRIAERFNGCGRRSVALLGDAGLLEVSPGSLPS